MEVEAELYPLLPPKPHTLPDVPPCVETESRRHIHKPPLLLSSNPYSPSVPTL